MAYSVTSATRTVTPIVTINGITLPDTVRGRATFSLDSPVPTTEIAVAGKLPNWIKRGQAVTVNFAGRIFTGVVKRRRRTPGESTIQCVGKTEKLWRPFSTIGWTFTNVTAKAAVEEILDDVGVTDRSIDMEDWTIGTVEPAILDVTAPGDAVQKIIDVDGHRMFEVPSGGLVIRPLLEVPAASVFRTYTTEGTAPWVLDVSDDEDEDQVKKKAYVSGAALGGTDAEGNASQDRIEAVAFTDSDDLVEGDPELYSLNYQNDLIQDEVKGAEVALRLVDKHHRIIERISLTVPLDPDIRLAMTIGVTDVAVTGRTVRWFVEGYTHSWGKNQAETTLSLIGGDQSGTTGKVTPIADFIYNIERELIGTEMRAVVSFHSTSRDLDGTLTDYHWTDDYAPPNDESGADLEDITFVYDPDTQDFITMILEVTDNDGLTASMTRLLYVGPGAGDDIFVPAIAAAIYNNCTLTPDGGWTWADQATPSGDAISVGASRYDAPGGVACILYGTDNGKIYRTTDELATAPTLVYTEPAGSPINHIWWDGNERGRVWACTQNGRLYWSVFDGVTYLADTWTLYTDFGGTYPLNRIATPPGPPAVWVYGGRADQPDTLIQWSIYSLAPFVWYHPDMSTFVPSAAGHTVVEAAVNVEAELTVILKGGREPAITFTSDIFASPVTWQDATGLDAGLTDGRLIVPNGSISGEGGVAGDFLAQFDTREMWVTTDGVAYVTSVTRVATPAQPTLAQIAGTLAADTYYYRVSAINDLGETLASASNNITIGVNEGVRVSWVGVAGATGYRIYGRADGGELLLKEVGAVTQWDDDGTEVPGGALPTSNTTAAVLPGTAANESYHAMHVIDHPNLYFGASKEGIWKTLDKGTEVNFIRPAAGVSTWPGGAQGRQLTFLMRGQTTVHEPDEVWAIIKPVAGTVNLYKLAGTEWVLVKADLGNDAVRLQTFGDLVFYQQQIGTFEWGSLMRSADGGGTFTPVLDRCCALTRGPDGTFWAASHGTDILAGGFRQDGYIWSSPDGVVWTERYHRHVGAGSGVIPICSLAVNRNNAQQIAGLGSYTVGEMFYISLNGGDVWATKAPPSGSGAAPIYQHVVWGQSERIIVAHRSNCLLSVSDDFGDNWVPKHTQTAVSSFWQELILCGHWLFALAWNQDAELYLVRSNSNGEAWEEVTLGAASTHFGLAYNPDDERLYMLLHVGGTFADVAKMNPTTAPLADFEASWTQLQYNWATLIGATEATARQQGVAVR